MVVTEVVLSMAVVGVAKALSKRMEVLASPAEPRNYHTQVIRTGSGSGQDVLHSSSAVSPSLAPKPQSHLPITAQPSGRVVWLNESWEAVKSKNKHLKSCCGLEIKWLPAGPKKNEKKYDMNLTLAKALPTLYSHFFNC